MAHCLLSHKEARELERDGKTPDCRLHHHLPAKTAESKVLDGTHRYVGERNCRIVPCEAKEWAVTVGHGNGPSGWQMRRIFRTKRTPAHNHHMQCGKQPRASVTQCHDVNHG